MICVLLPFPSKGSLSEHDVVAYIARSKEQLSTQLEQRARDHLAHSQRLYRDLKTEADRERCIQQISNSRLRVKARKLGVGAREFLRFATLCACVPSRVSL